MKIDIPFYDLINKILIGLLFIGCFILVNPTLCTSIINTQMFTGISTGPEIVLTLCVFAICYEIGLIINRIGSIAFEPILKKIKIIPFDNDYSKYDRAKEKYPIMKTLSREYALSRTSIVLYIILMIIAFCGENKFCGFVFLIFFIIFIFSCRKHAKKITALMNSLNEES